jgi:8-oxo-dGTP diphosphatase
MNTAPVGTSATDPGEGEFLAAYDPARFTPTAVTVDLVVLTIRQGRLCVLLVQRAGHPYRGRWALPGGFVEPDETLDEAAARELAEETGLGLTAGSGHLEQLGTYGDPGRDPRMRVVSVAYLALVPDLPVPEAGSDAAAARWWPIDDLTDEAGALAFDHDSIVADGVERARAKLEYTTLATAFVDEPFTLSDLRRVYETVWASELHGPNFARKVLASAGFVEPVGSTAEPAGRGRPAALYRRGAAADLVPAMLRPTPDTRP